MIDVKGATKSAVTAVLLLLTTVNAAVLAQKPSFEVSSIKVNTRENGPGSMGVFSGRLIATAVTLRPILQLAYRPPTGQLLDYQLIGAPNWIDQDRFDIEAKPEGDARPIPRDQIQLMVQSLLEDRFRLKAHRETRELPVYDLLVAKDRPKIQLSEDQTPPKPAETPDSGLLPRGSYRSTEGPSGVNISARAIPISTLVNLIQNRTDRRIVDKTNLKGLFDIELRFIRELQSESVASRDSVAPVLFTAIQEQLGLKMESAKAPVEVIVIDAIAKPSAN
jgi:uncharacterized protein (TIGR03435 family)